MAIERVDSGKCIGCGTCVMSCPMDVFRIDGETKKSYVKYPEECVMCTICVADCPTGAIEGTQGKPWMSAGY